MLKLKKNTSSYIFDWIFFILLFYIITDNLLIVLYLSKTYNLFSHLFVLLLGFLMAIKFINTYTILFPQEIYLDHEKIVFKNFMSKKEVFLIDININYRKKLILPFYKMQYNNDAAFISKIRYKDHDVFIVELNKRVEEIRNFALPLSNT